MIINCAYIALHWLVLNVSSAHLLLTALACNTTIYVWVSISNSIRFGSNRKCVHIMHMHLLKFCIYAYRNIWTAKDGSKHFAHKLPRKYVSSIFTDKQVHGKVRESYWGIESAVNTFFQINTYIFEYRFQARLYSYYTTQFSECNTHIFNYWNIICTMPFRI